MNPERDASAYGYQVDIFGAEHEPRPLVDDSPAYMKRDASAPAATPMRLFEPQMEGQLALDDVQLPTEGK